MKKAAFLVLLGIISANLFGGGDKISTSDYIAQWRETAMNNMKTYGIPASIILAQGILESGSGNSRLAVKGNNHFGIKCHGEWKGKKIYHDDDRKGECFRVYASAEESFKDHALFLKNKNRYAFLFNYKPDDYKAWAKGLKKAGYATNPKYPQLLIDIIERYNLAEYDKGNWKAPKKKEKMEEASKAPEVLVNTEERSFDEEVSKEISLTRVRKEGVNGVEMTNAIAGDTPQKIADAFDMGLWQIKKYNNIADEYELIPANTIIFLKPKRRKNCDLEFYTVQEGQGLVDVSQAVGVKMKHVLRINNLDGPQDIKPGMRLSLCKRVR